MKKEHSLSLILVTILLVLNRGAASFLLQSSNQPKAPVYVGVAFGGNTTEQAYALIDRDKKLHEPLCFRLRHKPHKHNETAAREICDYAVNSGLHIIINLGTWTPQEWQGKVEF